MAWLLNLDYRKSDLEQPEPGPRKDRIFFPKTQLGNNGDDSDAKREKVKKKKKEMNKTPPNRQLLAWWRFANPSSLKYEHYKYAKQTSLEITFLSNIFASSSVM